MRIFRAKMLKIVIFALVNNDYFIYQWHEWFTVHLSEGSREEIQRKVKWIWGRKKPNNFNIKIKNQTIQIFYNFQYNKLINMMKVIAEHPYSSYVQHYIYRYTMLVSENVLRLKRPVSDFFYSTHSLGFWNTSLQFMGEKYGKHFE